MAKKKSDKSSSKSGSKVTSKYVEPIDWREEVIKLNVDEAEIRRKCLVAFIAESNELYSEILEQCNFASKNNPINEMKCVNFEDLIEFVRKSADNQLENVDSDLKILLNKGVLETIPFLDGNMIIPCEIVAKLIKLYIITLISDDVRMNRDEIKDMLEKEAEKNALIRSIESNENAGKGGKKGKGKGKDKGKKDKGKGKGKGKKGKDKKDATEADICSSANKLDMRIGGVPKSNDIDVPFKELYVVLTGFYDPKLIEELIMIGVPLICVVEIANSDDNIYVFNEKITCSPQPSLESSFVEPSLIASQRSAQIYSNDSLSNSNLSGEIVPATRSEIIQAFWLTVEKLFEGDEEHEYLENTFHIKFSPILEPMAEIGTEQHLEQCMKVFNELRDLLMKIPDIKRRFVNYIRNIKLQNLGDKPRKVSLHCFKTYLRLMDKFPPDCFSIPLLLQCILEEVSTRFPQQPNAEVTDAEDVSIVSRESLFLEEPTNDENEIDNQESDIYHGGVRDQLVGVFKKYKKRHESVPLKNLVVQCRQNRYIPRINLKLSKTPFIVHENNCLEILINSYKAIANELFLVNLKALKKCKPALLWNDCGYVSEIIKLMNKFLVETWKNELNITPTELRDAIYLLLFNAVICKEHQENLKNTSSINENFPKKSKNFLINEASPTVYCTPSHCLQRMEMECEDDSNIELYEHNVYEDLNLNNIQWKEGLPAPVILQELTKADNEFLCMDHKYCPLTDTILLRFHNNTDNFGCSVQIWNQPLRTPVCFRDFCKYIVHEEIDWLDKQEIIYKDECEKEMKKMQKAKGDLKKGVYPEVVFNDDDFILPGSLKDIARKESQKVETPPQGKGKGKKGKDKKDKGKKGKKDKKDKKGKSNATSTSTLLPAQVSGLEKVAQKLESPLKKEFALRFAEVGDPYSFIGYDLSGTRLQLAGTTVTFHSLDGVKVAVDRTRWLGKTHNLSLNITCNNHSLILHHTAATIKEPFMFHLHLSNNIVIALAKPVRLLKPEVAICEKICRSIKENKKKQSEFSAYQPKRQELYFVSEKHDCVLKTFRIPFVSQRNIILTESLLIPFLETLEKLDIKAKIVTPPGTLRERSKRKHNLDCRLKSDFNVSSEDTKDSNLNVKMSQNCIQHLGKKGITKVIVKRISKIESENAIQVEEVPNNNSKIEYTKTRSQMSIKDKTFLKVKKEFLEKLHTAMRNHIPVFKICSSKLHKYAYVKRCKSYINIPIGNIVKRILCKPFYCRTKRNVEVTKCFPIGIGAYNDVLQSSYDVRMSLPSGLVIRNVAGLNPNDFHIKQYYVDKGPQCKAIAHEDSRTFMRNGNIMIKNCDGSVTVFSLNGNILQFEVPYIKKSKVLKSEYKEHLPQEIVKHNKHKICLSDSIPIHACTDSLTKFQKILHRTIKRRHKHMIDGNEARYYMSRKGYLRLQKKYYNDVNQFYVVQTNKVPFPEYSLIKPDGKKIKVTSKKIYEEQKYYTVTDKDFRMEQTYFEREDGTHGILDRDGVLATQYPDGTRITTWYSVDMQLVFFEEVEEVDDSNDEKIQVPEDTFKDINESAEYLGEEECYGEFEEEATLRGSDDFSRLSPVERKDLFEPQEEGWVMVNIYYQYEHPNYATVIYGGSQNEMKILLPNDVSVSNSGKDVYKLKLDNFVEVCADTEKIEHISTICKKCEIPCKSKLNISPLYHQKPIKENTEFLRVCDSYKKTFIVDYEGNCKRNVEFVPGLINKANCSCHCKEPNQKLFVLNKDLSGMLFWETHTYNNKYEEANADNDSIVNFYGTHDIKESAVEFRTYIYSPFHEQFLLLHKPPRLILSKYKNLNENNTISVSYIKQRVLNKILNYTVLEPFYETVMNCCKNADVNISAYETIFNDFVEKIHQECKKAKMEAERMIISEPSEIIGEYAPTITLFDKWYMWQDECKRLKELITQQYVPLYFESKFGRRFRDSYIDVEGADFEMYEDYSPEVLSSASKAGECETGKPTKATSTSDLPLETMILHTDKSRKITRTQSGIIETSKEELHITMAKDLVILCKCEKPMETVKFDGKEFVAVAKGTKEDVSLNTMPCVKNTLKNKLLILTNVQETSKVCITKELAEEGFQHVGSKSVVMEAKSSDQICKNSECYYSIHSDESKKTISCECVISKEVEEENLPCVSKTQSICENVECLQPETIKSPCQDDVEKVCENPECSYPIVEDSLCVTTKEPCKNVECYLPVQPCKEQTGVSCDNIECFIPLEESNTICPATNKICENPECFIPLEESNTICPTTNKICENPECFLSSSDNDISPCKLITGIECENPECFTHSQTQLCPTQFGGECDNEECFLLAPRTSICNNADCFTSVENDSEINMPCISGSTESIKNSRKPSIKQTESNCCQKINNSSANLKESCVIQSPVESFHKSEHLISSVPEYDEKLDTLKNLNLIQQVYEVSNISYTHTPKISDNVRATVSKIVSLLFHVGPYLSPVDHDKLIHPLIKEANLKADDCESICQAVSDEIINGYWLENSHLGDSTFNIVNKNLTTESLSSSDTIKALIKMLRKHLKKLIHRKLAVKSSASSENNKPQGYEYKVTYYLGTTINNLIDQLKFHVGELTWEKRLAIIDSALKGVTNAGFNPEELYLFVQNLDNAVDAEIKKLPNKEHFEKLQEFKETELDKIEKEAREKIIEPLIESVRRYKFMDGNSILKRSKLLSKTFLKNFYDEGKKNMSDEKLEDKSKLISITKVAGVLKHYSNKKSTPFTLSLPSRLSKIQSTTALHKSVPTSTDPNIYDYQNINPKQGVSFSEPHILRNNESSITLINVSNMIHKQNISEEQEVQGAVQSTPSSKVTITSIPKREDHSRSMVPVDSESIKMCNMCRSEASKITFNKHMHLYKSISQHEQEIKPSTLALKPKSLEGIIKVENEVIPETKKSIERLKVSKTSSDASTYSTEEELQLVKVEDDINEVDDNKSHDSKQDDYLFHDSLEKEKTVSKIKIKKPFLHRKPPMKTITEHLKTLTKEKIEMIPIIQSKVSFSEELSGLTVIHQGKDKSSVSMNMFPTQNLDTCSQCSQSAISSKVSIADFYKSKSVLRTSSMKVMHSKLSFDQSEILKTIRINPCKKSEEMLSPSITPMYASSMLRRKAAPSSSESLFKDYPAENLNKNVERIRRRNPQGPKKMSTGMQTHHGKDIEIQTSDELLQQID